MRRVSSRSRLATPSTATYYDRISLRLKPEGEPAVDRTEEPTIAATPGALPGATRTKQRVATVTITGWDPVNKVVTFTGPNGTAYSRRLLDTTDPKIVEGLKVGDRVDVTRTEAVTVSVQSATTLARLYAELDDVRHRLTVSVLFGWDNQFSGKMIQASHWSDDGGGAHQPGRDDLRRGVRPDRDVQGRRRLSDHPAHRGRLQLRVVQQ